MQWLKARVRKTVYFLCKILLPIILKIDIRSQENLPPAPSALVVANHASYLDVTIIAFALYKNLINIRWVISKENYRMWFLKWAYWAWPVIVVNGTVEKIKKSLGENKWVVVFPEGAGRWCAKKEEKRPKPYTGAAAVALSTGVTVIPMYLEGADKVLPPEHFKLSRQYNITVSIGKPFSFGRLEQEHIGQELLEKTTQEILNRIAASAA